jgi:hypothetical protein
VVISFHSLIILAASTMTDDQYSEAEDSSVETPPPPPPSLGERKEDREEDKYQEQLKIFQGMAEFSAKNEEEDMIDDDGSVEIPPPANYEELGSFSKGNDSKKYGMLAACLLVIIAIVLGVGFGTGAFTGSDGESESLSPPTLAPDDTVDGEVVATPSPDSREGRIRSYILAKSPSGNAFVDPTSPEALALQWMQDEDPLELDPLDFDNHLRLDQRYALMTVWFNSPNNWFNQTNWLNEDECTWVGVTCAEANAETRRERNLQEGSSIVTKLELEGNNLAGNIPADIAFLKDLQILNLASNGIDGPIPSSIVSLNQLTTVVLNDNTLTGDLTDIDFSNLALLQIFDVSSNELDGVLPDSMTSLSSIEVIVMDNNNLSGGIPGSISNLQTLRKLHS